MIKTSIFRDRLDGNGQQIVLADDSYRDFVSNNFSLEVLHIKRKTASFGRYSVNQIFLTYKSA